MSAEPDRSGTSLCLGGLSDYIQRVASVLNRLQGTKHSTLKEADSTHEVNITHIVHSNDAPRKVRLSGGITVLRLEESNEAKLPNAPLNHGIFCSSAWVHESSRFDSSARTVLTASAKTGAAA